MAAAGQRFVEAGYAATTIADVARAAGVAVQTVYRSNIELRSLSWGYAAW